MSEMRRHLVGLSDDADNAAAGWGATHGGATR